MILPLEKQVCSLEYSKKLKELGCPQESVWYSRPKHYSAYTCAELIYMLTKYRKNDIIIPVEVSNVADFLAQEVIDEKEREKKN